LTFNIIFNCLTSWVENSNSNLTWDWYWVESQDWYWVFESSHDIDIKYLNESESRYENLTWWSVYYLDMFNQAMIDQLSSHHFYDHKIELIDEETFSRSRLY